MKIHHKACAAAALCAAIYLLPGCSPLPRQEGLPVFESVPEGMKSEEPAAMDSLKVAGLGEGNTITGAELRFRVEGVQELDPDASIGMAINDRTKTFVPLASRWHLDPNTGAIVISAEEVREVMKLLPDGQATIILGLAGRDGEIAINVQFQVQKWNPKPAGDSRA